MLFDLQIFSRDVYPRAQPHAQSLFLFPIVFGINLIHLFNGKKDGAAGNSIVCFAASISCHAIWQLCEFYEECKLFRRVQRSWQRKVWTQRHSRWEKLRCNFLARKSGKLFIHSVIHTFILAGLQKSKGGCLSKPRSWLNYLRKEKRREREEKGQKRKDKKDLKCACVILIGI